MDLTGEYEPSTWDWVATQVERIESSGGTEGTTLLDTGVPVIVFTMRGKRSGKVRKAAVMRVEHGGEYALVASKGGDPEHPGWYHNLVANPGEVRIQDGTDVFDVTVREVSGDERRAWWDRAVAVWPDYAEYQKRTERLIPVLVASRA